MRTSTSNGKTNRHMNRRTILRGLLGGTAVSFALPTLEAMLNASGTPRASKRWRTWSKRLRRSVAA